LALLLSNVARRSAGDPARPGREFINGPFSSEELIRSIHHLTSAARTQLAAACSI